MQLEGLSQRHVGHKITCARAGSQCRGVLVTCEIIRILKVLKKVLHGVTPEPYNPRAPPTPQMQIPSLKTDIVVENASPAPRAQ